MSAADLLTAIFKPARQLGPYSTPAPDGVPALQPFSAQVTIEEHHEDELEITGHPVEKGASIADHAFIQPSRLTMRLGWSNSGVQAALQSVAGLASVVTGDQSGDFNYMQTMYDKLLQLQASRIPFDVTTGKRKYNNMLIKLLSVPTEDKTEHCLIITMTLKHVIIVSTQAVSGTPASVQANPQTTGPVSNLGTKQPILTNKLAMPLTVGGNGLSIVVPAGGAQ